MIVIGHFEVFSHTKLSVFFQHRPGLPNRC